MQELDNGSKVFFLNRSVFDPFRWWMCFFFQGGGPTGMFPLIRYERISSHRGLSRLHSSANKGKWKGGFFHSGWICGAVITWQLLLREGHHSFRLHTYGYRHQGSYHQPLTDGIQLLLCRAAHSYVSWLQLLIPVKHQCCKDKLVGNRELVLLLVLFISTWNQCLDVCFLLPLYTKRSLFILYWTFLTNRSKRMTDESRLAN